MAPSENAPLSFLPRERSGGERGIRTLDTGFPVYSLSRRAPSASRPSLHIHRPDKNRNIVTSMRAAKNQAKRKLATDGSGINPIAAPSFSDPAMYHKKTHRQQPVGEALCIQVTIIYIVSNQSESAWQQP